MMTNRQIAITSMNEFMRDFVNTMDRKFAKQDWPDVGRVFDLAGKELTAVADRNRAAARTYGGLAPNAEPPRLIKEFAEFYGLYMSIPRAAPIAVFDENTTIQHATEAFIKEMRIVPLRVTPELADEIERRMGLRVARGALRAASGEPAHTAGCGDGASLARAFQKFVETIAAAGNAAERTGWKAGDTAWHPTYGRCKILRTYPNGRCSIKRERSGTVFEIPATELARQQKKAKSSEKKAGATKKKKGK